MKFNVPVSFIIAAKLYLESVAILRCDNGSYYDPKRSYGNPPI